MSNLKVADRRKMARDAATRLLGNGVYAEDLTLRMIAKEDGVPLSTLTYAYQSIAPLLYDLLMDFESNMTVYGWGKVGNGGLRRELRKYVKRAVIATNENPANLQILRFMFATGASGAFRPKDSSQPPWRPADQAAIAGAKIAEIGEKAGEHYRLPADVIGAMLRAALDGVLIQFLGFGDVEAWKNANASVVDTIVLAADPRPVGQEHAPLPFKLSKAEKHSKR